MAWIPVAAAIAAFASTALATASTKCPVPDLCFSLEIPDLTLASATGDIFLSITGPTTYASITLTHSNWLSREQDHFHVTLNPENSNVEITRFSVNDMRGYYVAAIERLPGCGLSDGKANAKMRCSTCDQRSGGSMEITAPIEAWDWTYRAANLSGHELAFGTVSFDSFPGSLWTQLRPAPVPLASRWAPNGDHSASRGPPARTVRMAMAHGILACTAWAVIFPLGGILIRSCSFRKVLLVHAFLQIFGLCLYTVAVGLGVELGLSPYHSWIRNKHAIIGLAIYGLFLTQAASGYIHHLMFKKYISRTTWSYVHLWTGRSCITLAMINGGFGLQLRNRGNGSWKVVLYTVCSALMWIAYVTSSLVGEWRCKRQMKEATSALESGVSIEDTNLQVRVITEIPKHG